MFAEDPTTGVAMRARVDMLAPDVMIDLKTARSADPERVIRFIEENFDLEGSTAGFPLPRATAEPAHAHLS